MAVGKMGEGSQQRARILNSRGPVPFSTFRQALYPSLLVHLIKPGALAKEEGLDLIS